MENHPTRPRQQPLALRLILLSLGGLIGLFLLLAAILGLYTIVVGVASLFVDGRRPFGSLGLPTVNSPVTSASLLLCLLGAMAPLVATILLGSRGKSAMARKD